MPNVFLPAECPRCRMALRVRTEYLGRWVACRYCGELFQVGSGHDTEPTAAATTPTVHPAPASASAPNPAAREAGSTIPAAPAGAAAASGPLGVPADAGSEPDEALEFAAERHRFEVERRRWEETRRVQAEELERARAEAAALAADRDTLDRALAAAEDRAAALAAAAEAPRPAVEPIPSGLLERLADLQAEVEALRGALAQARAPRPPDRLPVLCRDLARWSVLAPVGPRAVATPVGPAPLPPSLDDLAAVDQQIASLRALLKLAPEPGKAYHTLFDLARFQALQQKLKEAQLLSERLLKQVERSRNQKDLLFHLMLAQRNDEINRRRR